MLTRYHANGDMHDKLVQDEYDQICASIHVEADQKSASRWSAFFRSKGDIHRLTICILLGFMQEWTGNGMDLSLARFISDDPQSLTLLLI